jgi:hypothetical protein
MVRSASSLDIKKFLELTKFVLSEIDDYAETPAWENTSSDGLAVLITTCDLHSPFGLGILVA